MPVYNAERYVSEAIESILNQIYSRIEFIIVIDEGCSDDSAGIVRNWANHDTRIRFSFMPHGNACKARRLGISLAQGQYIAHMDADDVSLPERLTTQLDWMDHTRVDICGCCVKTFDGTDGFYWFPETHEAIRHELFFRIALFTPTMLLRAEIAKEHLLEGRRFFEDYELWIRLVSRYRVGNVPQVLYKWRSYPQQASRRRSKDLEEEYRAYRPHHFFALFPEASSEDYAALACVAEKRPLSNLAHLERAGFFLARLARTSDRFLRRRMAERWFAVCRRSAHLGWGSYRLYRSIAPRFDAPEGKRAMFTMQLACALRIRTDSWIYNTLGHLRRALPTGKRRHLARTSRP
jgi:glycosyltransferase involved in cell wall biosynthesis